MIKGDSSEYELLIEAVQSSCAVTQDPVLLCEIGVREGLGSKLMLDAALKHYPKAHLVGIDPYGNLDYAHYDDKKSYRSDYTNTMKNQLKKDMADYESFHLLEMTDAEFMYRFRDGYPIYDESEKILKNYTCVHFDGPHQTVDVLSEALFFAQRSHKDTTFCFDDYPKYDMDNIARALTPFGFKLLKKGKQKLILRRET